MTAAAEEKEGFSLDWSSAYLGFCVGLTIAILLDMQSNRRNREKVRRHLERALEEVDD